MSGDSKAGGFGQQDNITIPFGEKYAGSDKFSAIFKEGMSLVEATAAYLDGEGREDAKALEPPASLAYATESMRLTTRLMQIASWLLIRRAVNEGELTPEQAREEKTKVKLKPEQPSIEPVEGFDALPVRLRALIEESMNLNRRILRLDALLHAEHATTTTGENPLGGQLARLHAEFGTESK